VQRAVRAICVIDISIGPSLLISNVF
jgi:hypothetical protein